MVMNETTKLWHSKDERDWLTALDRYWDYVKDENLELERELIYRLDARLVNGFNEQRWYVFLRDKYFRWKYTAPNRYATTTYSLQKYIEQNSLNELYLIKKELFNFNKEDIKAGLKIAKQIKGLGAAGASGLLALLFPRYFGTIDQFAVKALLQIDGLPEHAALKKMNPDNLSISNGVVLVGIMRRKAQELNQLFCNDSWTPRKIDMILWGCARES